MGTLPGEGLPGGASATGMPAAGALSCPSGVTGWEGTTSITPSVLFSCASTDLRGEQDLAVESGKVGLELLQLVLLFPDFPDDLFQDGEFLLNGFVVPRVFLYQAGDAVEGVDEVLAGGFRIDRQAAVVIVVEEVAFTTHEETVLAEVQTVLDGGVGLDNDVEAIERADDLRLAVRAFPVLYLVELGGNHFRIIACHAVNLQGVEPVALLVVLHTALDGGLVLPDTGDDVIVACPVRQESFQFDA